MLKAIGRLLGLTESVVKEKREPVVPLPKRNIVELDIELINVHIANPQSEMLEQQALIEMYPFLGTFGDNAEDVSRVEESAYHQWRRNAERTQQLLNKIHPLNKKN